MAIQQISGADVVPQGPMENSRVELERTRGEGQKPAATERIGEENKGQTIDTTA